MMTTRVARPMCAILAILTAVPSGFAQSAAAPVTAQVSAPLHIAILEGNNVVNSIPLLRSIAPVVEVRDENDFPLEGAAVVFTLPEGAGAAFATGGNSFTTRSDSHGQASGPLLVPKVAGKLQIKVTATAGSRRADAVINQTNSASDYFGPAVVSRPFYKRRLPLILIGGAVAAGVAVVLLTRGSGSTPAGVSISTGTPVFH